MGLLIQPPFLIFFFTHFLVFCPTSTQGMPNIMFGICYNITEGTYTENSLYHSNLLNAFSNLTSLSSFNTFSNFSAGSEEDRTNKVYALYNCRYDLSLDTCHNCVTEASKKLLQRCNGKEGIVYYEECILRYANRPIVSIMELGRDIDQGCATIGVLDEGQLKQLIESIFKELIDQATSGNSTRYFAVGQRTYAEYQTVYGLVQCTPDITREECRECLTDAFNITAGCASTGRLGGALSGPSCQLKYEFTHFYNISSALPPMSSPPGLSPRPSEGGRSFMLMGKLSVFFANSFLCYLILCFCLM